LTLFPRSNDALKINPPAGDKFALTTGVSDWLWAVTALYLLLLLIVVGLAYFAKSGEKILHYLFTISLFVGGVSYFTIASDLGSTPVPTSTNESGTRQIFYVLYINWFVGWTPLLIALGLVSGVSWSTIVYNIALSWIWVASWLSGSLIASTYKWGFFTFGLFAYFLLSASLLHTGGITAKRVGILKQYWLVTGGLVFVWLLYPIAWGVADGGNKIGVSEGFIFWGILDVFTVPVLSFALLFLATKWDYKSLNLYFTQYGRIAQTEFPEKKAVEKNAEVGDAAPGVVAPEQAV